MKIIRRAVRKFQKKYPGVLKDKDFPDIPSKYLAGSKNKSARAAEIRKTRRLYKMGKLSAADFDRISKLRARG